MPGMPRGGRGRRFWDRKAVLFWRAALGCHAAALPLAGLAVARSSVVVWLGAGLALLAGLWCQRSAAFARRLAERDEDEVRADVPGD